MKSGGDVTGKKRMKEDVIDFKAYKNYSNRLSYRNTPFFVEKMPLFYNNSLTIIDYSTKIALRNRRDIFPVNIEII